MVLRRDDIHPAARDGGRGLGEGEFLLARALADVDDAVVVDLSFEDEIADTVLEILLDGAPERTGTVLGVVASVDDEVERLGPYLERVAHLLHTLAQFVNLQVGNGGDSFAVKGIEEDDVVDAVEKLRSELALQALHDETLLELGRCFGTGIKAHAASKVADLLATGVAGKDDNRIAEVHGDTL